MSEDLAMVTGSSKFFLIIGSRVAESIASKLSTRGTKYVQKSLSSGPDNWNKIADLMKSPDLVGVVVTIQGSAYKVIAAAADPAVEALLAQLGKVPHLALVYESVFSGITEDDDSSITSEELSAEQRVTKPFAEMTEKELDAQEAEYFRLQSTAFADEDEVDMRDYYPVFSPVSEGERVAANARLEAHNIGVTVYKRNVEASALAVAFIDDTQNNLIFRVYVPSGQLFEDESSQLATMFSEWLRTVKGKSVRQGGYQTAKGRVIEFFSDGVMAPEEWKADVTEFQSFLSIVDNPDEAEGVLVGLGVDVTKAAELVSRYATRTRRLQLDIKQERERKTLAIHQELESEVSDHALAVSPETISAVINRLVPAMASITGGLQFSREAIPAGASVQINQQFINQAEGVIAQHISGNIVHGAEPEQILALIREFAGAQAADLSTALHEVTDATAPDAVRLSARQRLKTFLFQVGGHAEIAGLALLQKWVEHRIGL
jgi:antitoxin component of RelBE/YafQ-DinJ toxin-antitoxin module